MRLVCVTDNCVQRGSALWGEHGLCFWVGTEHGSVLWDTGQTPDVLNQNLGLLGLAEQPIDAIGLSHAHYDHSGALMSVLERHPGTPVYGNASLFEARYSRSGDRIRSIGLQGHSDDWRALAAFSLSDEPQELVPGVATTGRIAPRPYPQGASPNHVVERNGAYVADPYDDDMSLVLQVSGGVVLLCGCCHAGLRNTLSTLRAQTSETLLAIIGGTHLADATTGEIEALIDLLRERRRAETVSQPLHRRACALRSARGVRGSPVALPSGTVIDFD